MGVGVASKLASLPLKERWDAAVHAWDTAFTGVQIEHRPYLPTDKLPPTLYTIAVCGMRFLCDGVVFTPQCTALPVPDLEWKDPANLTVDFFFACESHSPSAASTGATCSTRVAANGDARQPWQFNNGLRFFAV